MARLIKKNGSDSWVRREKWYETWPYSNAWFIQLNDKDNFDIQAIMEMSDIGAMLEKPQTEADAKAAIDRINRRSSQLRTFAKRGYGSIISENRRVGE